MVVEISRNDGREAVFAVASDDIPRAKLGMAVNVSLQGRSDIATTGTIREISPEADRTTGTYQVKVALPSTRAEMRLGAVVVGRVETEGKEVAILPAGALLQSGDAPQVWVVGKNDKVERRKVQLAEFDARLGRREPRTVGRGEGGDCRGQFAGRRRPREARDGGQVMTRFNLSEWAVHNRALVVFLMLICVIGGVSAYERLGRQEDPDFTVKTMVVQAVWPGATATDTLKQVTDRLEKKLEETPNLDYIKSYTKPGQATIFVYLKESTPKSDLNDIWYQVRKKVSDIRATLPQGVVGPFFNDEFGDVFGIIYGITFDGFTPREARDFAETARAEFLRAPDVGKVEIYGDQDEKVYLNFSPQKLANLKLSLDDVLAAIARQNAVAPTGIINTPQENMLVDVTGSLLSPEDVGQPQSVGQRSLLQVNRHRRGPAWLQRPAHQDVPRQRQAGDRHRGQHARGRQQSRVRQRPARGGRTPEATLPRRGRAQPGVGPARGGARGDRRVYQGTASKRSSSCSRSAS